MAEMYFVDDAAADDLSDGKDHLGLDLSSMDWMDATGKLTDVGQAKFASYTPAVGDIIHIASATAGNDGWYLVSAKVSSDELTLGALQAGTAIGSDQTDVTSSDGPFKVIQTAENTIASGDKIWVKAGTYGEELEIGLVGLVGANTILEAYTSVPGDFDETADTPWLATIDGAATRATCLKTSLSSGDNAYWIIKGFRFTDSTSGAGHGVDLGNLDFMTFISCRSDGHAGTTTAGRGFNIRNMGQFHRCQADGNADKGFVGTTDTILMYCKSFDNVGNQMEGNGLVVMGGLVYNKDGAASLIHNTSTSGTIVLGCTLDGWDGSANAGTGISCPSSQLCMIVDNIISRCTIGVEMTGDNDRRMVLESNAYWSNTDDSAGLNTDEFGKVSLSSDPYRDSGAWDYTPVYGSGVRGGGVGNEDLGSIQRKERAHPQVLLGGN